MGFVKRLSTRPSLCSFQLDSSKSFHNLLDVFNCNHRSTCERDELRMPTETDFIPVRLIDSKFRSRVHGVPVCRTFRSLASHCGIKLYRGICPQVFKILD